MKEKGKRREEKGERRKEILVWNYLFEVGGGFGCSTSSALRELSGVKMLLMMPTVTF